MNRVGYNIGKRLLAKTLSVHGRIAVPVTHQTNFTMVEATSNFHGLTITNLLLMIFLETIDYSKIQIRLHMMKISLGELLFGTGRPEFILIRML